jgi:hypothetical protein
MSVSTESDCQIWLSRLTAVIVGVCFVSTIAAGAGKPHYLITNDHVPPRLSSTVTFYTVGIDGSLTMAKKVITGGVGIGGGYFAANRISVLDSGNAGCIYASDAFNGDVTGIVVKTLKVGGRAQGSSTDTGTSNGIGLAMNAKYLYASFTDSSTIGTFQVKPGCKITFW